MHNLPKEISPRSSCHGCDYRIQASDGAKVDMPGMFGTEGLGSVEIHSQ